MTDRREPGARRASMLAGAVVATFAADSVIWSRDVPLAVKGALDWGAHIATCLVVLDAAPGLAGRISRPAVLAASVAIDLDHAPGHRGIRVIESPASRPYPHSLATVALALSAAALPGSARSAAGTAVGVALHLLRDLATGGAPLLWPRSSRGVAIPYPVYAALMVGGLLAAIRRPVGGRRMARAG